MRFSLTILLASAALTGAAHASLITSTTFYDSMAAVNDVVIGGMEFDGRGDTTHVSLVNHVAPATVATPYGLWESGVGRGFSVVYNLMGTPAGVTIDDVQAIFELGLPIDQATNGLLISAYAPQTGLRVQLTNLKLTLPNLMIYDIPVEVDAQGNERYLIAEIDAPLANGFIVSGTVAMTWGGGQLPPPSAEWFQVTPVVIPEPASIMLLVAGPVALVRRRR